MNNRRRTKIKYFKKYYKKYYEKIIYHLWDY